MKALPRELTTVGMADVSDQRVAGRIEAFVDELSGSVFHRPAWLRAVERGTGQRALGLLAETRGTITGWLPLTEVRSPIFGNALVSSGFGVGGGTLATSPQSSRALCNAVIELAHRRGVTTVELRGGDSMGGWQAIEGKHANFARDLESDEAAQLAAIPRKARAEVRKSLECDFEITSGARAELRDAHYSVYCQSVRNLGTPVFPRALFDAVLDEFADDAEVMLLRYQGRAVASVLSLYHHETVMPYWGGGTSEARAIRANDRMYFELMKHARSRGAGRFDFGRSKVGSGPYFFKKNWGFTPEPLTYQTWFASGAQRRNADPSDSAYSSRVALWKRLPLPIANRLGPKLAKGLG